MRVNRFGVPVWQRRKGRLSINEGCIPNVTLHWVDEWFFYICIGKNLRWHWYRKRG